jgi:hypothetical protein
MKTLLKAALVWALFAVGAVAQQADANAPATREDVEKYLAAINSHQMMAQMMDAMAKPMHQMVHDQYLKDKDKLPADFEERTIKMLDDLFRDMPFDQMMQATVPVYQKHLTKGDIDALVAFYSSPTGQKMLHELPAIMGETMQAMMPSMEKYMETVRQRIDEQFTQALKKSEKKSN